MRHNKAPGLCQSVWTVFTSRASEAPVAGGWRESSFTLLGMTIDGHVSRILGAGSSTMYLLKTVPRQFVHEHFVYDTSSTDISSTDISSTTVYHRVGELYIQLLLQIIIIFINSNFYLHYDSALSIPLQLTQ